MWKVLELMYQLFQKDGFDYFTDMMPALHNYITVDTRAFLSNENHIVAMFNMCKAVSIKRSFCLYNSVLLSSKQDNIFHVI